MSQLETENSKLKTAPADDPNYVPYFTEIEDTFIRRRGKSMFVSPIDWALMESWNERGIPLHVVLRSIEEVFDNAKSRAQTRRINSLRYCQDEVEEQFRQYGEMMVGSHEVSTGNDSDRANPFSKDRVFAHLQAVSETLLRAQTDAPESLRAAIGKAIGTLGPLSLEYGQDENPRSLEDELTKIDCDLGLAIGVAASPEQVMECREKVETAMAGYARSMTKDAYQQTFDTLLAKALRELFGLPRLSLFHMK